jgi:hypothetical protein
MMANNNSRQQCLPTCLYIILLSTKINSPVRWSSTLPREEDYNDILDQVSVGITQGLLQLLVFKTADRRR